MFWQHILNQALSRKKPRPMLQYQNWWPCDFNDNWFHHFFHNRNLLKADYKINLFSVFGDRNKIQRCRQKKQSKEIILFFTGEDVHKNVSGNYKSYQDYCLTDADLVMGYDYRDAENYLRFPLWILSLTKHCHQSFNELKQYIDTINAPQFRLNANRTRFASLIARHDTNGVRAFFINLLNQIDTIDCAGTFANNTDELIRVYHDNKIEYLKNFKFNICPENGNQEGYVTEKLFESIMSGCIPVYWGNGTLSTVEPDVLNQNAFLRCLDTNDVTCLYQQVEELYKNPHAFIEFAHRAPFTDTAAEWIWERLTMLENRVRELTT